jgi:hypothetical protein
MGYRMVVVGATGNVGREMLNILAERQFPGGRSGRGGEPALDRRRHRLRDSGKELKVQNIEHFDFTAGTWRCSRRIGGQQGARAAGGGGGLHGDRQQLALSAWTRTCR